ncbi:hypothetical protein MKQ70_32705 [Chitinophaga sedimenti]|uniref:hypothetical protein n=1 Tax=Chitinophaga sedimenti TaxID=2033606 RepID=UPI002005FFC1|nr:hypothetical protein [Chitinophaga sedimenti]MCK7559477.1 hypothetical protein [Chitinophaga sedimenti]
MLKSTLRLLSVSLSFLILYACSKQFTAKPDDGKQGQVSLAAARKAFTELTHGENARDSMAPTFYFNKPDWQGAKWKTKPGSVSYLEVPLTSDVKIERLYAFYNKEKKLLQRATLPAPWLMFYKDSIGAIHYDVVQHVPNTAPDSSNLPSLGRFSGEVKKYDWYGAFRSGVLYNNGVPSKRIKPGSRTAPSNARWEHACYTTSICVFSASCSRLRGGVYQVTQAMVAVETQDGGCYSVGPNDSPESVLMQSCWCNSDYVCGWWSLYNSSQQEYCDWYWFEDDPTPDPNDPGTFPDPEVFMNYYVESPPPGDIVSLTEFLKCFNQSQAAKFTIYADQPIPNTRMVIKHNLLTNETDVGHAFVTIEQTINGNTIKRSFGYYPSTMVTAGNQQAIMAIRDDATHPYDVALSADITSAQLTDIIAAAKSATSMYHLTNYNCTNYAITLANLAGMDLQFTKNPSFPGCNLEILVRTCVVKLVQPPLQEQRLQKPELVNKS